MNHIVSSTLRSIFSLEDRERQRDQKCERELTYVRNNIKELIATRRVLKEHSFCNYDVSLRSTEAQRNRRFQQARKARTWLTKNSDFLIKPTALTGQNIPSSDETKPMERHGILNHSKNTDRQGALNHSILPIATGLDPGSTIKKKKIIRGPDVPFQIVGHKFDTDQTKETKTNKTVRFPSVQKGYWRKLFPGEACSSYGVRHFIEEEKKNCLWAWSPEAKRKRKTKKMLEQIQLPAFIERSKTTSAIFRDYDSYRKKHTKKISFEEKDGN